MNYEIDYTIFRLIIATNSLKNYITVLIIVTEVDIQ